MGLGTVQVSQRPAKFWAPQGSLVGKRTADHRVGWLAVPRQEDGGLHMEKLLTLCHPGGHRLSWSPEGVTGTGCSLTLPDDFEHHVQRGLRNVKS